MIISINMLDIFFKDHVALKTGVMQVTDSNSAVSSQELIAF